MRVIINEEEGNPYIVPALISSPILRYQLTITPPFLPSLHAFLSSLSPSLPPSLPAGALQPAAGPNTNYVSAEDTLVLEDESGRVNLTGPSFPVGEFVTGLVVAVKGHVEGGAFIVADVCVAGLPPQEEGPGERGAMEVDGEGEGGKPRYVLLASGECFEEREGKVAGGREGGKKGRREGGRGTTTFLFFPQPFSNPPNLFSSTGFKLSETSDLLPLQMLIDYVQGHVGSETHKRDVSHCMNTPLFPSLFPSLPPSLPFYSFFSPKQALPPSLPPSLLPSLFHFFLPLPPPSL